MYNGKEIEKNINKSFNMEGIEMQGLILISWNELNTMNICR